MLSVKECSFGVMAGEFPKTQHNMLIELEVPKHSLPNSNKLLHMKSSEWLVEIPFVGHKPGKIFGKLHSSHYQS